MVCFQLKKSMPYGFDLDTSAKGGSWTVISGKDILPQQKGHVRLNVNNANLVLEAPKVKSDSRYEFAGSIELKIGPSETYEEYKKKSP